jgi:hypothetical protein
MILISHRGNINGRIEGLENTPNYIQDAIKLGYDVEIDLWIINNNLYLGHDDPVYKIDLNFLSSCKNNLWIHCKNIEALVYLIENLNDSRFFFHEYEKYVITNRGDILVHAQANRFPKNSVYMIPEVLNINKKYLHNCKGVCSDYIINYKDE